MNRVFIFRIAEGARAVSFSFRTSDIVSQADERFMEIYPVMSFGRGVLFEMEQLLAKENL